MVTAAFAGDTVHEIELKLLVDADRAQAAWPNALAAGLASKQPAPRLLTSTYHDTARHDLRKAGIALRVRTDAERIIQTVKSRARLHAGVSRATETESLLGDATPDLAAIQDDGLREQIMALIAHRPLTPVFQTIVQRAEAEVCDKAGTRALLAVDEATVMAGDHRATFHELEIELLSGPVSGLFAIARTLVPSGRVRFSQLSKAERGFLLAQTGKLQPPPAPRFASRVKLAKKGLAGHAITEILRECSAQVSANVDAVLASDAAEGPHQLRIGLRRLRSALSLFRKLGDDGQSRKLSAEARWLGQEVGKLRDLQVIGSSILPRFQAMHASLPGAGLIAAGVDDMARQARGQLCDVLNGDRVGAFLFDLACFVEAGDWTTGADAGLQQMFAPLATSALDKRWRKVRKAARHIAELTIEQRHALRKELKKLRYAVEFFGPLFRQSRVKPFLVSLKQLQDIFGEMNDAAMLEARMSALPAKLAEHGEVQFAAGVMTGYSLAGADMHWRDAKARWLDLKRSRPFWK